MISVQNFPFSVMKSNRLETKILLSRFREQWIAFPNLRIWFFQVLFINDEQIQFVVIVFAKHLFLKLCTDHFFQKKEKLFAFSVSILWSVPKGGQTSYISSTCIWTHPITDITYRPGQNTQLSLLLFPTVKKYLSVDCYGNFANTIRFMAKQFLFKILLFVYCELTKSKYKLEQPELCREI